MIYNMAGGGSVMHLDVVAGTAQPASPDENTIWINTSITVGNIFIQANSPDTTSLSAGDVWISTLSGAASDNTLTVFDDPFFEIVVGNVKVWSGSAWLEPEVSIYKNGAWHAQVLYIYTHGSFSQYGDFSYKSSNYVVAQNDVSAQKLKLGVSTSSTTVTAQLGTPIDVSKYNTLSMICSRNPVGTNYSGQYAYAVGLNTTSPPTKASSSSYPTAYFNGPYIYAPYPGKTASDSAVDNTVTTDISSVSAQYYITFSCRTNTTNGESFYAAEIALIV